MAGLDGYASFTEPYLLEQAWLDTTVIDQPFVQIEMAQGVYLLPTHAGTHIPQRCYRGEGKPADYAALRFTLNVQAGKQVQWEAVKKARAKGVPVYFTTGARQEEVFQITNGSSYTLSRPLASGVVTGVTSLTHPTILYLDGVADPTAAAVSGQTVTAADDGELLVIYTPAHKVIVTGFSESIGAFNDARLQITLEEVLL